MRDGPQPKLAAWGPHGRGKHERDIKLLSNLDEEELEIFRKLEEQVAEERHRGGLRTRFSILRTIASMKDGELIELIALYQDGLKSGEGGGGGGSASGGSAQQVDSSQQVAADMTETSSAPPASLQPESSDAVVGLPELPAEQEEEDPPVAGGGRGSGGGAPKWQAAGAVEESPADTPPGLGLASPEVPAPVAPPQHAVIPDVVPEVPDNSTGTTGQDWGVGAWMPEESLPPPPAPAPPPPGPEVPPPPPIAAPVTAPVAPAAEEEAAAWRPQPPVDHLAAPPSLLPVSDPPTSIPPPINGDSREDEVHVASTPANEPPKSEREIPTSSSGVTSKLSTSQLESWFRRRAFELRVGPTSLSAGSAEVLEVLMGLEDSQLAPPYTEVKMWLGFEEQEDMPESLATLVNEFRAIRAKDSSHLMSGDGRPVPSGKDFPPPPVRRAPGGPNPKGPVAPPARAGGGKASAWR